MKLDKEPVIILTHKIYPGTVLYIKKSKLSAAIEIYEQLFEKAPKEKVIIKRLAGLYAKTGQEEKARSLVEYLNKL